MSTPPPMPSGLPSQAQLSYATPAGYAVTPLGALYADGALIVSPPIVALPQRCVFCNEPEAKRVRMKYTWHHPLLYLLIPAGLLIYAIVALVLQKKGQADISLCALHASRRFRKRLILWLLPLVMVGVIIAGPVLENARIIGRNESLPFIMFGILGAIITLAMALLGGRLLRPKFIDERVMKLSGAGGPFLRTLGDAPRMPIAQPVYAAPPVQ